MIGELVSVIDANQYTILYQYDPFCNRTQIQDSAGNQTHLTYDIRGRKLTMTDPDMGFWQYTYDSVGDLMSQTDAKGQTVTMAYDPLSRITSRKDPDGTTTWIYDNTSLSGSAAIGKLSQIIWGPSGCSGTSCNSRTYVYDGEDRAA